MKVTNVFALLSEETYVVDQAREMEEGDLVVAFYEDQWILGSFARIDGHKAMVGHFMDDLGAFSFWGPVRKIES